LNLILIFDFLSIGIFFEVDEHWYCLELENTLRVAAGTFKYIRLNMLCKRT
jgi:hypothetical protein